MDNILLKNRSMVQQKRPAWLVTVTILCLLLGETQSFSLSTRGGGDGVTMHPTSSSRARLPFTVARGQVLVVRNALVDEASVSSPSNLRQVAKVEQFARLPVWPVWMGVMIFVVSRTLGKEWAAKLEDACGGRVCPNFFSEDEVVTSPFIMLVHHRHSFAPWDPIRWFQNKFILPEGFPAHPHRGFTTLTYILKGGFRHRDSLGIAQDYGANPESSSSSKGTDSNNFPHSQWLFTGAGLLHEEMFNNYPQQELYQLWINVPSHKKMQAPEVCLLGDSECPRVVDSSSTSQVVVLAGSYGENHQAKAPIHSPMTILHVTVEPGKEWSYPNLPSEYETVVLYIRKGSCEIGDTTLPVHHTAYLEPPRSSTNSHLTVKAHEREGVDFLLLAGAPLNEPIQAQGSMVMNQPAEIQQAYLDYQRGMMGQPWSHELTDEEWKSHIAKYPSRYAYTNQPSEEEEFVSTN